MLHFCVCFFFFLSARGMFALAASGPVPHRQVRTEALTAPVFGLFYLPTLELSNVPTEGAMHTGLPKERMQPSSCLLRSHEPSQ